MALRDANNNASYDNTLYGSGVGQNWVPQLYSSKILTRFYENVVYTEITNTDYEGQIRNQGDKVLIRFAPDVTINAHKAGDTLTYQQLNAANIELNIDQAFDWAFQVIDEDETQFDVDAANKATANAARLLQIEVEKEMFTYMAGAVSPLNSGAFAGLRSGDGGAKSTLPGGADTANTSGGVDLGVHDASVALTTTNIIDYIVYLNQILDEQDIPNEGRWVVLPAWACSLLKRSDLKQADITGDSTGVIRTGMIGMIDRTMVYMSNNLYSQRNTGDTLTEFNILAGLDMATTFAAQISKSEQLRIQDYFGNYYRGLLVYGRKVVRPEGLAVLVGHRG